MNSLPRLTLSLVSALLLVVVASIAPATKGSAQAIDRAAIENLHDALQDAKDHGDPIEGDISEEALAKELEDDELEPQAGDGCSTPDATKKLTQKYDKVFRSACDKHDVCYMPNSTTDRKDCDDEFSKDMTRICGKNPQGDESQCLRMATIYKAAVRAGGKNSYKGKGKNN